MEKVNIVIDGSVAWVTFDQIGSDAEEDRKRRLRILHRVDGIWKIGCVVVMECTAEETSRPLIEVGDNAKISWMNGLARQRIRQHPGLVAAAGRLQASRRERDGELRDAVCLAYSELQSQRPLNVVPKQAWPVILGEECRSIAGFYWRTARC